MLSNFELIVNTLFKPLCMILELNELIIHLNQYDQNIFHFSYGGLDLNNAARRKNATRETTSALKAWLYEHRKNPYPTKGEKIMLAIITKMTLTQVSTWFANARRRLKKESKSWNGKDRDLDDSDIEADGVEGTNHSQG